MREGGERVPVVVRERLARVVGRADLREDDVVEHDVRDRLLDAVRVRQRGADADDITVERRRGHQLGALDDTVRPEGDRVVRMEGQRLLPGLREARERERDEAGEQHDPAHERESSRG